LKQKYKHTHAHFGKFTFCSNFYHEKKVGSDPTLFFVMKF